MRDASIHSPFLYHPHPLRCLACLHAQLPAQCGRLSRYIKFTSALETNNKVRAAAQDHCSVGSLCHPAAAGCSALLCLRPPALQELHEQVMEMRNTIQQLRNELESRPTSVRYDSLMAEVRRSTAPAAAS